MFNMLNVNDAIWHESNEFKAIYVSVVVVVIVIVVTVAVVLITGN